MRILITTESFYPVVSGVSVVSQRFATAFTARGHEVVVVAPSMDRRYHKETKDGYTVYRLPSRANPFKKGGRFAPFSYRYVKRVFDEVQPDVVHIHSPISLCRSMASRAHKEGVPVVATQHFLFEYLMTFLPTPKSWRPVLQAVTEVNVLGFYNSKCSALTVPTQTLKTYLDSRPIDIPITVISNGVDMDRFKPGSKPLALLKKYRLPTDRLIIGYVGRVDKEKNLEVVLQALALLKDKLSVQFVVIGAGLSLHALKVHAKELGVAGMVRWLRPVANQDKLFPQLFNMLDVFCMTSPIETESMVTIEAMASGLPVLGADGAAVPELVKNGRNGYVLPADQPEIWADKIVELARDEKKRKQMAVESRSLAGERDFSDSVEKLEELYAKLLS